MCDMRGTASIDLRSWAVLPSKRARTQLFGPLSRALAGLLATFDVWPQRVVCPLGDVLGAPHRGATGVLPTCLAPSPGTRASNQARQAGLEGSFGFPRSAPCRLQGFSSKFGPGEQTYVLHLPPDPTRTLGAGKSRRDGFELAIHRT